MVRRMIAGVGLWLVCAGLPLAQTGGSAQTQTKQTQTQSPRPTSRPYTGDLSIFDYPDRGKKLQIDRVMDLLGITTGKNVGDLGAGSGWFTVIASKRVGATGAVIAEDINPIAIEYIGKRVTKEGLENVRTVLGTADDPGFPPGSLDAVLMLKVYHEIAHPVTTMKKLKPALRPGAKVGIIDKSGNGSDHGVNQDVVVKEMGEAGYALAGTYDFTKADGQDYFLIFTAK
ncbi:MAG TPA: class I SAM-dependent methyltransferase [Edaphobacter sp.]